MYALSFPRYSPSVRPSVSGTDTCWNVSDRLSYSSICSGTGSRCSRVQGEYGAVPPPCTSYPAAHPVPRLDPLIQMLAELVSMSSGRPPGGTRWKKIDLSTPFLPLANSR